MLKPVDRQRVQKASYGFLSAALPLEQCRFSEDGCQDCVTPVVTHEKGSWNAVCNLISFTMELVDLEYGQLEHKCPEFVFS